MWKFVSASATGTSHFDSNQPCQDTSACKIIEDSQNRPVLIIVVADGAGSARRSHVGSAFVCTSFISEVTRIFAEGGNNESFTRESIACWLTKMQAELDLVAAAEGLTKRDFASTFLAGVVADESALFLQVGDGAIVVSAPDETSDYAWIFWPQHGEYINETNFATDAHATQNLDFQFISQRIDEIAIFSDGLEHLVLQRAGRQVHCPFFAGWFKWLSNVPVSSLNAANGALATYLDSSTINERTDDDKSIAFAIRMNDLD